MGEQPPAEPPAPVGSLQAALPSPGRLFCHACSGAALGRAQGHSPSSDREGGAPKKKSRQTHTYRRTTAWEEGEERRGGQRNSHANLVAASSSRKQIPGAPGELCPGRAEETRMSGGCSPADRARPVLPR